MTTPSPYFLLKKWIRIRIRIPNSDPDPKTPEYGSMWIRMQDIQISVQFEGSILDFWMFTFCRFIFISAPPKNLGINELHGWSYSTVELAREYFAKKKSKFLQNGYQLNFRIFGQVFAKQNRIFAKIRK